MTTYIIIGIFVFLGTFFGCYSYWHKRVKEVQKLDEEIQYKNKKLQEENNNLLKDNKWLQGEQNLIINRNNELREEYSDLNTAIAVSRTTINQLEEKKSQLNNENSSLLDELSKRKGQIENEIQQYYEDKKVLAESKFEESVFKVRDEYLKAEEEYKENYALLMEEAAKDLAISLQDKKDKIVELNHKIDELQSITNSAIEASKRQEEMETQKEFYKIQIPKEDLEEVEMLRSIIPQLRNPEALNKVIWKVYYEKPVNDLIGRVIGTGAHTGIYKITNTKNNKCYVGQAVNLADRWKQHIKRGLGAETATKNKLYPIMKSVGVENFTFEVIEECERDYLDKQEDYWQEYFHAKDYGYSIK